MGLIVTFFLVWSDQKHGKELSVGLVVEELWSGVTLLAVGYLVIVNGTLTAFKYQDVLEYSLVLKQLIEEKGKSWFFNKTIQVAILQQLFHNFICNEVACLVSRFQSY